MKRFILLIALLSTIIGVQAERMNIIFETDMGNDVDDALAIDMLYKYNRQGRINLMAVMLNKEGEFPPKYIDLLNTWYKQKHIPIGMSPRVGQSLVAGANYTQVVCEKKNEKGKPIYKRSIKDYSKLLPAVLLYRKLLAKVLDEFGFTKAFRAIGTILIVKLGLPLEEFPLPINDTDKKYGDKALKLILKHGNWGQYERSSHDRKSLRYMFERAFSRISNQLLFLRLSPKYNRSLLFSELPDKTWGRLKSLISKK